MLYVPQTINEVTPGWLTKALQSNDLFQGLEVIDLKKEFIGTDFGFASTIARLKPTYSYNEVKAPSTIVVKLTAFSEDVDRSLKLREKNRREAAFYREIGQNVGIRIPYCFYSAHAESSSRIVLLLEDLEPVHFGDVEKGCSEDEAGQVMDKLANLHAQWWNDPRLKDYDWLSEFTTSLDRFFERRNIFLERFASDISDDIREFTLSIGPDCLKVFGCLEEIPTTLVHVDMHLDNIAFSTSDSEIILFDWQGVAKGRGAIDVGAFLSSSFGKSQQLKLIERYHAGLINRGVLDYSQEQCKIDCRVAMLRWWIGTVCGLGSEFASTWKGRQARLTKQSVQRRCLSIREYKLAELIK
jgi:thiamine kinase-like enzyme